MTKVEVGNGTEDEEEDVMSMCFEDWNDDYYLAYNVFLSTLQFLFPFTAILTLYHKIWMFLRSNNNLEHLTGMSRLWKIARMQRTNKMLVAVSVMFLASLLPLHLFNLSLNFFNVQEYSPDSHQRLLVLFSVFHLLAMSSVITNPIMYGLLNFTCQQGLWKSFRSFRSIFRPKRRSSRP